MSEFAVGAATVIVRPDTTQFRALLQAQITEAVASLKVPPVVVPVAAAGGTSVAAVQTEVAAATKASTAAITQNVEATAAQAAVTKTAAIEAKNLASAQLVAANAAQAIALASRAGATATGELAAARAVLKATDAAVTKNELAVAAALKTTDTQLISATQATLAFARAEQVAAAEAFNLAKATSVAAAPQEQLRRGFLATALSLFGVRGATLAAGTQFLIGAASLTLLAKAVKGATEDEEALASVTKILGQSLADDLNKGATRLAHTFGIVDDQALRFESIVAQTFRSVGVSADLTAKFSERLVAVAADLRAFRDVPIQQTLDSFRAALLGNVRGLRQYGIGLTQAEITERALAQTGKDSAEALTNQEKVLARYSLLLEKTKNIVGAFADESNRLTGQSELLKSNIDELSDTIGSKLLPFTTALVKNLNDLFNGFRKVQGVVRGFTIDLGPAGEALGNYLEAAKEVTTILALGPIAGSVRAFNDLKDATRSGTSVLREMVATVEENDRKWRTFFQTIQSEGGFAFGALKAAADSASVSIQNTGNSLRLLNANLAGLEGQLLDLQFAGAPASAQIAKLQQSLDKLNEAIANPKVAPGKKLALKRRRNAIQDQIQAIVDEQNAANQAAADAATKAAKDAADAAAKRRQELAEALAKHDEAVQAIFEFTKARIGVKAAQAQLTKRITDDIQDAIDLRNEIQREIRLLPKLIKDANTRKQLRVALQLALAQARGDVRALFQQQQENRREARRAREEAKQRRRDNLEAALELNIEIAQAGENVKGEIRARQRLIAFLKKQQRDVARGTNEWRRLQLAIIQEQKAIEELRKANKDKNNAAASLGFEFLQAQQGFAANVMSNLLPVSAVQGTVGGQAPAQLTPTVAQTPRGQTQGQTATMIEILRQILVVLQGQSRTAAHPEARHQRAVGSAAFQPL